MTQCRKDKPTQYVKTYTIKFSLDGKTFTGDGKPYEGRYKSAVKHNLHGHVRIKARYIRFYVQTWGKDHPSMRADALVIEKNHLPRPFQRYASGISAHAFPDPGVVTCGKCPYG